MLLELRDVRTYYGQSQVLQGVSMEIDVGEVVALLGRNGAGKTTTVSTIMGFTRPRSGSVWFDGREITRAPTHEIARRGLSLVPQERRLFSNLSVEENLTFGIGVGGGRQGGRRWTLDDVYELFPNLERRRDNRAYQLSGGEQQMVAIGRALLTEPDLVLMDEPSEGLAPRLVEQVERVLRLLRREHKMSVLLIEQNLPLAARTADRGYVLEKGRIKAECSVDELEDAEELVALS